MISPLWKKHSKVKAERMDGKRDTNVYHDFRLDITLINYKYTDPPASNIVSNSLNSWGRNVLNGMVEGV